MVRAPARLAEQAFDRRPLRERAHDVLGVLRGHMRVESVVGDNVNERALLAEPLAAS